MAVEVSDSGFGVSPYCEDPSGLGSLPCPPAVVFKMKVDRRVFWQEESRDGVPTQLRVTRIPPVLFEEGLLRQIKVSQRHARLWESPAIETPAVFANLV